MDKFNVYCLFNDDEEDGDPRKYHVSYEQLEKVVKSIINKFLKNELWGSFKWSPIYYHDNGISLRRYNTLSEENKQDCEVNKLRISCYPTCDSEFEDTLKIVVDGLGNILRSNF